MTDFGVCMLPTDYAIQPVRLARAAEERGFESLFFPEHSHIPASRRTPWPGGEPLPREYWHTHDPFVALAAAASVTTRLKLGTGICLIIERDPITLAKEVASLDTISNGRVILGIGGGWNAEEMENHGVAFTHRWRILREKVLAVRAIWTQENAEFHGEYVNFDPIWSWPKPVQKNGPPILLGADSKWAAQRVVEYCDGWMPIAVRGDASKGLARLREAAARAGRKFESLNLTVFGVPPKEEGAARWIEHGFHRILFGLPPASPDVVLPILDRAAEVARKLA
ncbi:MAG TPA: LLM class F420-dependent oxidoreductase [Deltaproteobacteria bacterium]|nr:LLM class F420-dependent oxidoreductase [Deltaproteobacteria bacterium]